MWGVQGGGGGIKVDFVMGGDGIKVDLGVSVDSIKNTLWTSGFWG